MPGRITPLVNQEFYHLYNRGADKRDLFLQPRDHKRFIQTFYYYQFIGPKPRFSKFAKSDMGNFKPGLEKKLVDIICFCLMPNHFHFLVRQLKDNGISKFISQLINSYTKYFNTKYSRVGSLFQGTFKAVHIESDEQLLHLSRYIHLNPVVSGLSSLESYPWSSYHHYMSSETTICNINEILNFFPSVEDYNLFLKDQIDYGTTLEILKHRTVESDEF